MAMMEDTMSNRFIVCRIEAMHKGGRDASFICTFSWSTKPSGTPLEMAKGRGGGTVPGTCLGTRHALPEQNKTDSPCGMIAHEG